MKNIISLADYKRASNNSNILDVYFQKSQEIDLNKVVTKLNDNFNADLITEEICEKAFTVLDKIISKNSKEEVIRKGTPGNYSYEIKKSDTIMGADIGKAEYDDAQKEKIGKVMHEFKHGKLHSGSKKGEKVTDRKQAIAIALSEAGVSFDKGNIDMHDKAIEKMENASLSKADNAIDILKGGAKGSHHSKHKYLKIENGKYIYDTEKMTAKDHHDAAEFHAEETNKYTTSPEEQIKNEKKIKYHETLANQHKMMADEKWNKKQESEDNAQRQGDADAKGDLAGYRERERQRKKKDNYDEEDLKGYSDYKIADHKESIDQHLESLKESYKKNNKEDIAHDKKYISIHKKLIEQKTPNFEDRPHHQDDMKKYLSEVDKKISDIENENKEGDNVKKSLDILKGKQDDKMVIDGKEEELDGKDDFVDEKTGKLKKNKVKKAGEIEPISEELFQKEKIDILKGVLDTSKLVKKKVPIQGKNGVYYAFRWVDPNTGMPLSTGKESKEIKHIDKKNKEKKVEPETDFETKLSSIMTNVSGKKSQKIRDIVSLGIYDPKTIMTLDDRFTAGEVVWYLKDSGIDPAKLNFSDEEGGATDKPVVGTPTAKPGDIPQTGRKQKESLEIQLMQKRKEKRAALGLTYKDFFNEYEHTMEDLIKTGYPKSLIAYGTGGVGKTFELEQTFQKNKIRWYDDEINPDKSNYDAVKISGATGLRDMWQIICDNKDKIIVFDDCDSMWTENNPAQNWLKAMLDTTGDGNVRNGNAGKDDQGNPMPKSVKFTGKVIFISNLPKEDFPQPLIESRCAAIDLTMTKDEILDKLDNIKYKMKLYGENGIELDVPKEARERAFNFFKKYADDMEIGQINGRTLAQVAQIYNRSANEKAAESQSLIRMRLV